LGAGEQLELGKGNLGTLTRFLLDERRIHI